MKNEFNYAIIDNDILRMQSLYKKIDSSFKELRNILKEIKTKEYWDGKSCDKFIEMFESLEKNYDLFLDSFNTDIISLETIYNNYKELESKLDAQSNLGDLK